MRKLEFDELKVKDTYAEEDFYQYYLKLLEYFVHFVIHSLKINNLYSFIKYNNKKL